MNESIADLNEETELDEEMENIEGIIKERECPTPIPENIYICAECNIGFNTSQDVQVHMTSNHQPVNWEERIKILESKLRLEKGQHQDHLNMLEVTLRESSEYRQKIKGLEEAKKKLEAEVELLRQDSPITDLKVENDELKKTIVENEKQVKNIKDIHNNEIKALKLQQIQSSKH